MTVSAIIGGEQWVELATTKGLGEFRAWVESLEAKTYPTLSHLLDWGWTNTLDALAFQIEEAVIEKPPNARVQMTINGLLSALETRDSEAETIMLTNGLIPADDELDEWWSKGKRRTA